MAKKVAKKVVKKTASAPAKVAVKVAVKKPAKPAKPLRAVAKLATKTPEKIVKTVKVTEKTSVRSVPVVEKQVLKLVRNEGLDPQKLEKPVKTALPVVAKAGKKEKKVKLDKSGLNEDQAKWAEYFEKHQDEKPQNYSISGQFEAKKPLQHKLFGWGFIISNEYDRLEVLFESGKRMLISNRKL